MGGQDCPGQNGTGPLAEKSGPHQLCVYNN